MEQLSPAPGLTMLAPGPASDHGWSRFNSKLTGQDPCVILLESASLSRLETIPGRKNRALGIVRN